MCGPEACRVDWYELVAGDPLMLAVNAQLRVRSLGDLLALAKAKPGELSSGIGARATDVVMHQINSATGINVIGVTYKSPGADLADAIAGHVQIAFDYWALLEPLMKSGKLPVLAVATSGYHRSRGARPRCSGVRADRPAADRARCHVSRRARCIRHWSSITAASRMPPLATYW